MDCWEQLDALPDDQHDRLCRQARVLRPDLYPNGERPNRTARLMVGQMDGTIKPCVVRGVPF